MRDTVADDDAWLRDGSGGGLFDLGRSAWTPSPGIYWTLILAAASAVAALPVVRVPLTVQAPGVIRPSLEKHELRLPVASRVEQRHVADGAAVDVGTVLFTLDDRSLRTQIATLEAQRAAEQTAADDFTVLLGAAPEGLVRHRAPRVGQEARSLVVGLRENHARQRIVAAEVEAITELVGNRLASAAELQRVRERLAVVEAERAVLLERRRVEWMAARDAALRQVRQLDADLARLTAQIQQLEVRAPVAGTVEQVAAVSAGSLVQPGDLLAVVSPTSELVVESRVTPRDIGLVRQGQRTRVEVEGFDRARWGVLPGVVQVVSSDVQVDNGRSSFKVRSRLLADTLRLRTGEVTPVRKGMSVWVRYRVAEQTLWEVLVANTARWFDARPEREGRS